MLAWRHRAGLAGTLVFFVIVVSLFPLAVGPDPALLRAMGAGVEAREGRYPPFTVSGASLTGIDYELPVPSAQVKSCVLMAGLLAAGSTTVVGTARRLRPQPTSWAVRIKRATRFRPTRIPHSASSA